MKKTLQIAKNIFTWAVVALAVFMMFFTVFSVMTFDQKDRNVFGYKLLIVRTDSMKATNFAAGDLIFSKEVDPATLKEGDIITFQSVDPESYGEIITHKIRSLTTDENGMPAFITYGTTTGVDDKTTVAYSFVLGKYTGKIPGVGKFFQFLKTTPGYIICILIPFLLLILMQGFNSIKLFRRYRQEQVAALNSERQQIEQERQASAQMMQELLALKAQLGQQTPPPQYPQGGQMPPQYPQGQTPPQYYYPPQGQAPSQEQVPPQYYYPPQGQQVPPQYYPPQGQPMPPQTPPAQPEQTPPEQPDSPPQDQ